MLATEGNAQTRYLRDAICTARAASLRGLSTLFEYTLLGTLVTGLVAGGLQSTSTLRTPDIIPEDTVILELPHLASASVLATPGVADSGADTLAAGALASSSTLAAPSLATPNESIAAGSLASTSILTPPSFASLWDALIRAYKLEDLSDELGGSDLSVQGSPAVVTGVDGNGFSYNGSTSRHITDWYPQGSFTVSAWLKSPSLGTRFFGSHDRADHRCFFGLNVNGAARLGVGDLSAVSSDGIISPNVWTHFVLTYNGSLAKLYVNGSEVISSTAAFSGTSSTAYPTGSSPSDYFFQGEVDELYIWDTAIDAAKVSQLYAGGSGLFF